jgi:hypothetical protein
MPRTLEEIRRRGLQALRRELGRTGMVRFLQQFETGSGDYARGRREWVDDMTLERLRKASGLKRRDKRKPRKGENKKS